MISNGIGFDGGTWGSNGGISISESPGCVIDRNIY